MGKLKFHPLFVVYVFLCIYFGWFNAIFYYVVSVVLHEYGHYFVAKKLGYDMQGIIFGVYGAGVRTNNCFTRKHELQIAVAGPLVNLVLLVLIIVFWWCIPSTYLYTYDFFLSNVSVMIFNLLPVYPLDGGRCLALLLSRKYKKSKVIRLLSLGSMILGGVFVILFLVSLFIQININLLVVGLFLLTNGILYVRKWWQESVFRFFQKKDKVQSIKFFRLKNLDKIEMLRCVSGEYYAMFIIGDDIRNIKTQDDLFLM